ncbi:glycoside hydrolase family 9 protein [Spirilliplanes yamanashiensis]|uniref:Endoglucanase n=1 Tax=Spirilliplanes yamanashiensis TaxID=42233 RepID=A0A8J4DLM9_9ACTN|nr:glycoside hydrolase family 9 protein [Spirilliplanes yamanashiensis]MDP9818333.1 endoglucanase [Spirilliplanes yamanashiensis]GIJ06552.1 endoglucanase [Spirilliplanes yamanashiensis]
MKRRRNAVLGCVVVLAVAASGGVVSSAAHADEVELIANGTFDDGTAPWWSTPNVRVTGVDGRLCAEVPAGTVASYDAIVGLDAVPLVAGERYRLTFSASADAARQPRVLVQLPVDPFTPYVEVRPQLGATPVDVRHTFTSTVDLPAAQVQFQLGGAAEAWTFCLDDVSLLRGVGPDIHQPDTGPRVRVNQVAYLPHGPKNATVVTTAVTALPWRLNNARGVAVATGRTRPRGVDQSSGQNVHSVDFTRYVAKGAGYTLVVDGETSHPFDISSAAYERLRVDALKFYYTQRSGVAIREDLRPGYGRPAGHVDVAPNRGDRAVGCAPGACAYTLDVTGGWYDAGDHGKYVVNGGISAYQLMNLWERTTLSRTGEPRRLGDRNLALPESGNGVPDVLDEARWQQEWMLKMQVPAGQPLAGMAHHKVHDVAWTGLPLMPHQDPQPRQLYPPSTAATLNLAATAAQAARVFQRHDRTFARRNLAAARAAWAAALAHPAAYAPAESVGGGPYDDTEVSDEFYWAAAQLYLTTGERQFRTYLLASPLHRADVFEPGGFFWRDVAALARLDLALVPNGLPDRGRIRASVLTAADRYLATQSHHPYGVPYAPAGNVWEWGSNSAILNNAVVLAAAFEIGRQERHRTGAIQAMDYILGRNALNQSYVTGYGELFAKNQHSRWYANQLDMTLPHPPNGTLAGGPNSNIQDPVAQERLAGCVAQFCYLDDIQSWSTNELTINWNASLASVASFVADQDDGRG